MSNKANPTDTAVAEFLHSSFVDFTVNLVGPTERDRWECDEWRVTFKRAKIELKTAYFTGTGHRVDTPITRMARVYLKNVSRNSISWRNMLKGMKPVTPSAAGVLHSLVLDGRAADMSFIDWCDEFGRNPDSRKDLAAYDTCCETGRVLRSLFPHETRAKLEELLQDY